MKWRKNPLMIHCQFNAEKVGAKQVSMKNYLTTLLETQIGSQKKFLKIK